MRECKTCKSNRSLKRFYENKDKLSYQRKVYYEKNRDKLSQNQKFKYIKFKELRRSYVEFGI